MKFEDAIKGFKQLEKELASWEATETIFDEDKAYWELINPEHAFERVCLFRDQHNMFVYGDKGQLVFDSMTWHGDVYNLRYEATAYQMEKLNKDCRESLYEFCEDQWVIDMENWLADELLNKVDDHEEVASCFIKYCEENSYITDIGLHQYCENNDLSCLHDLLYFIKECFEYFNSSSEELQSWGSFLESSNLKDFDEPLESSLLTAGQVVAQRYFICMYALKVCGEKLTQAKAICDHNEDTQESGDQDGTKE